MFPFPIATPTNCNIQTFYGENSPRGAWNKPPGVSHVYILIIGAGGNGDSVSGGGSGGITIWYGAAQHVPDTLYAYAQTGGGGASSVRANSSSGIVQILLASGGSGATGGTAQAETPFASFGFYKSIAGQNGINGPQGASTTTFLSGGGGGPSSAMTSNYGYTSSSSVTQGFFQMQPIIVGMGGSSTGRGGIGCGGGKDGIGGPGMVLIASW